MIKVGLVGFGLAGKVFHAPLIDATEDLELAAIVSSRSNEIQELYPNCSVFATFEDLLAENIDLIVIATPNHLHFSQAKQALDNGKHVIIDKPIAQTSREAKELANLAKNKGLYINVFHNRRFDGDFLTIRKLLAENKLGRIFSFESNFNRFRPEINNEKWRETTDYAGGIFYDLAPHLIDQALVLFGWPKRVFADIAALRVGAENADYFHLIFDYDDKKIHLNASCMTAKPGERFKIHGDKDTFSKFGLDPQEEQLKKGMLTDHPDFAREKSPAQLAIQGNIDLLQGNYLKFYQDLAAKLIREEVPEVSFEQGIRVLELMESCLESLEAQSWVKL